MLLNVYYSIGFINSLKRKDLKPFSLFFSSVSVVAGGEFEEGLAVFLLEKGENGLNRLFDRL